MAFEIGGTKLVHLVERLIRGSVASSLHAPLVIWALETSRSHVGSEYKGTMADNMTKI